MERKIVLSDLNALYKYKKKKIVILNGQLDIALHTFAYNYYYSLQNRKNYKPKSVAIHKEQNTIQTNSNTSHSVSVTKLSLINTEFVFVPKLTYAEPSINL